MTAAAPGIAANDNAKKRPGPKTVVRQGDRYQRKVDVADVARHIRRDIRNAKKAGTIDPRVKVGVRIRRSSMSEAIYITASERSPGLRRQLEVIGKRYQLRKTHDQPDDWVFCNFYLFVS